MPFAHPCSAMPSSPQESQRRRCRRRPLRRRRRAESPSDGERHAVTGDRAGAPVRVGLAGLGSMGRNHLRVLSSMPGCRLVAVADPVAAAVRTRPSTRATRRASASRMAMIEEADLDALVIAAPTMAHVDSRAGGHRARYPRPRREAAGRDRRGRAADRPRVAGAGRPGPGRPRRTLQPGRARARPAPRGGLAEQRLRHRVAVAPGPFPARIRDVGRHRRPRHARRRHPVVDRRRAAPARLRRGGAAPSRHARGPALRAAPLSFGRDRNARRQLADARQATAARRGRRGRHVRAGLPHAAPDVHEGRRHRAIPR